MCSPVEHLFYIAVAMLTLSKDRLLLMDFNDLLLNIGHVILSEEDSIENVLQEAREVRQRTPESMIMGDFIGETESALELAEESEYFKERWWELARFDYSELIHIPLISAHDALNMKKDQRLLLDVRGLPFDKFAKQHVKSSLYFSPVDPSLFDLYA